MKNNTIRLFSLALACVLAVAMISVTALATDTAAAPPVSKYEKPDTNFLTNLGQDPEEMSVSSKAEYFSKQWYEYIAYSDDPVASYRIDGTKRLVFFDPYNYVDSMIMEITYEDEFGEWGTQNSIEITHEFSKSFSGDTSSTVESSSDLEQAKGEDITGEISTSVGESISESVHTGFSISREDSVEVGLETSAETTASATVSEEAEVPGLKVGVSATAESTVGISESMSTNVTNGYSEDYSEDLSIDLEYGESSTVGWSSVADRITTSTGSSSTTSRGWSTSETVSITRTFEALYFTDSGTPYHWTIAHYEMKMPMKAILQYQIGGKWVTVDTDYILLSTVKGSCRAWNVNNVIHYEDWATSQPVADTDFWSGYYSPEELVAAYENKMFPE